MQLVTWDRLPQSRDDIIRKFAGTYVKAIAKELGREPRVMCLHTFEGGHAQVSFLESTKDDKTKPKTVVIEWQPLEVVESFPEIIGAIPFFNKVLFLKRNPARQWQVGLSQNNSEIRDHSLAAQRLNLPIAEALYNPSYESISVQEAVDKFTSNERLEAFALNSVYWLKREQDARLVLYRNQLPLGSFTFGKLFLNSACSDFRQELWDDLRLKG